MKKLCRVRYGLLIAVLAFLGYVVLGTTLPFVHHKEVSETFMEQVKGINLYGESPGAERAAFVKDNNQALLYRFQMMEEAQTEIIMSTFDFDADEAGKDMMAALLHAADRGIKVKVVIDGFSGFMDVQGNKYFLAFASHDNVEVKIYNPINLWKPWAIQTRLHDKYLIIDDKMYLLGGRNNTNLFLGDYQEHKNIDRELLLYETHDAPDSSLKQVKAYFERIWEMPECQEFECRNETEKMKEAYRLLSDRWEDLCAAYPEILKQPDWIAETFPVNKVTLLTNPIEAQNKEPKLWYTLHQLMQQGEDVIIHTPYIICGDEMYQDLSQLCAKGTFVDIITNDVTSGANPWGCTDYLNEKENILDTGVTVHEYLGNMSNHTKTVLIDDRLSIVGSYNLDMRSTYLDTEMMLAVDSEELNRILRAEAAEQITYSKTISKGQEYVYGEHYEEREFTTKKKITYALMRIIIQPIRYLL